MPSGEIIQNGFRGVFRITESLETEKAMPNFMAYGHNVVLDLLGNTYVITGTEEITGALPASGSLTDVFWSSALERVVVVGDRIYVVDVDAGTYVTHAFAMGSSNNVKFADWMPTGACYLSNGSKFVKLTNSGATLTDLTATKPLGMGKVILVYESTLWSFEPTGYENRGIPSTQGDPEDFDAANAVRFLNGGDGINDATVFNGDMHVHKPGTIYKVIGDVFIGNKKNFQVVDKTTGVGAVGPKAAWVEGDVEYFIGFNGLYRFNGAKVERISKALDGVLTNLWTRAPSKAMVCLFSPTTGPDAGAQYALFRWIDGLDLTQDYLWRYNIATGDWLQDGQTQQGFTYARERNQTFVITQTKLEAYANMSTTSAGVTPVGEFITQAHDAGSRIREHHWKELHLYPGGDASELEIFAGMDGIYPTIPLSAHSDSGTAFELPNLNGFLMNLRFRKSGGGKPMVSGYSLIVEEAISHVDKDWAQSRRDNIEYVQKNYPVLKGGQAAVTAASSSVTITHGMGQTPVSIIAVQEGWDSNEYLKVADMGSQTFTVHFQSGVVPVGTEKIHWIAVLDCKRLFDSFMSGGVHATRTSETFINHNMGQIPDAVFLTSQDTQTHAVTLSNLTGRRMLATPQAGSPGVTINWMTFKEGLQVDDWFQCGTGNGNATITHGYSSEPLAVVVFPNSDPIPTYSIANVGATTFDVTCTGDFYWVALNPVIGTQPDV